RIARGGDQGAIGVRRAERPLDGTVGADHDRIRGWRAGGGLVPPELRRRRIRRQDRRHGYAALTGGALSCRRNAWLHEDVDRAAARQPDVPGLLVADPVADDAAVAVGSGAPHFARRRRLVAAYAAR